MVEALVFAAVVWPVAAVYVAVALWGRRRRLVGPPAAGVGGRIRGE